MEVKIQMTFKLSLIMEPNSVECEALPRLGPAGPELGYPLWRL